MSAVLIIKLFTLTLAFTVTQANAATISNHLDQSNILLDGDVQVTISDSATTATVDDINIGIKLNASMSAASDTNIDSSLSIYASKTVAIDPEVTIPEVIMLFGSFLIGLVVLVGYNRSA